MGLFSSKKIKIDIYMACPACLDDGYHAPFEYWIHSGRCGGTLALDEDAIVSCRRCDKSWKLTKTELRCNAGRHQFRVPSTLGLAEALATSAQFVGSDGGLGWLMRVMERIDQ